MLANKEKELFSQVHWNCNSENYIKKETKKNWIKLYLDNETLSTQGVEYSRTEISEKVNRKHSLENNHL